MTPTKNLTRIALCLILLLTAFAITLTSATTENNYKNDNNFLTNISETTHTENGYKANIIINPHITGIYATENGYKLDLTINTHGIGGSHKENNYKLDLIPEKTFPDISDIAVTKIVICKNVVGQGYSTLINITVSNQALNYETFCLITQANTTTIKTQTITLTSRNSANITFTWNTAGFAMGNYTIWAYAWPLQGETYTADNTCADGWVFVGIVGDVNGNRKVDLDDVLAVALAYGSLRGTDCKYWHQNPCHVCPHSPNCDIDCNGKIDLTDYLWTAINYGKVGP